MNILVVEDDDRILSYLRDGLRSHSIAVDTATDGEDALAKAGMNEYDAIVLDVVLPKLSGCDVCKRLREQSIQTPIIMLSVRGDVVDRVHGLDSGADDYLPKPFSFTELLARIRAVMRRKDTSFRDKLTLHDLTIDPDRHEVMRGDDVISLSPLEYRILEFLVRNHGKVFSIFEIMENVWGSPEISSSNLVSVHMCNLRSKIDKGRNPQILHTIRSRGYVIK